MRNKHQQQVEGKPLYQRASYLHHASTFHVREPLDASKAHASSGPSALALSESVFQHENSVNKS